MSEERILEVLGELEHERQDEDLAKEQAAELSTALKARLTADALRAVRPAEVHELRSPWLFRTIVGIAAIAAASAFVFLRAPALPRYELTLSGGERALRSGAEPATATNLRLAEGGAVLVELRPDEPINSPMVMRAYLYAGGALKTWDAPVDMSSEGALRAELVVDAARAAQLGVDAELIVVLARGDDVPAQAEIEESLRAGGKTSGDWRLFRRRVELAIHDGR